MGYPRIMGPGCAGATSKMFNVNVNQIQFGDKLQGLPPVTGRKRPYKSIRAKEGGNLPDRHRIYCINQLGSIGMGNKNSQFAANADGVGPCPNKKNRRGWHGLHQGAIGSKGQSRHRVDKISRVNEIVGGSAGIRWQEITNNDTHNSTSFGLTEFPSFETNLSEDATLLGGALGGALDEDTDVLGGSPDADEDAVCPSYAPYPYSGKQAGQPSSPQPAWCCADFTNPTSTGCGGKHVKCDPDDSTNWTTCKHIPALAQ